jgi:hypothetical protein
LRTTLLLSLTVSIAIAGPAFAGEVKKKPALKVLVLERTVTRYGRPKKKSSSKSETKSAAAASSKKIVKLSEKQYTVKLAAGRLREVISAESRATVIRADLGLVWFLDTKNRTYREMSFKKINAQKAEALERLKRRLPIIDDAEQNQRIKKLLGLSGKPPELTIEYPGKTSKVAGEKCRLAVVKLDGKLFFKAWISERAAPAADRRWLRLGCYFSESAAKKLAAIKGLLMAATFPLPEGGRMEIATSKVTESVAAPGDFDDPGELGYKKLGKRKKPTAKDSPKKKSK